MVLLRLDMPSYGEGTEIRINMFSKRFVSSLHAVMNVVHDEIKPVLMLYPGVFAGVKGGYPREFEGFSPHNMSNAVISRIDGLEAHLDTPLSYLLKGLHRLEDGLLDVARGVRTTFARLNKLQFETRPCLDLFIVGPAAAVMSRGQRHFLWAILEGSALCSNQFNDLRLCLLCPYDFIEVPCGLDGSGYNFTPTLEWIKKILPALKVRK